MVGCVKACHPFATLLRILAHILTKRHRDIDSCIHRTSSSSFFFCACTLPVILTQGQHYHEKNRCTSGVRKQARTPSASHRGVAAGHDVVCHSPLAYRVKKTHARLPDWRTHASEDAVGESPWSHAVPCLALACGPLKCAYDKGNESPIAPADVSCAERIRQWNRFPDELTYNQI
jgi:hypothetical protein